MPAQSAKKKAVRERMAVTGESYMEARRHIENGSPAPAGDALGVFGWMIQQHPVDPMEPTPYEWVLRPDGATYGFVDHGILIGVLQSPNERGGMRHWQEIVESGDVAAALVGTYPVTVNRFTRAWSTWTQPIGWVRSTPEYPERSALYGGPAPEGTEHEQRMADLRAEADRRWAQEETATGDVILADGDEVMIEAGGCTRHGMIHGFVTPDAPRATVLWADVEQAVLAGERVDRLVGMRLVVQPDDHSPAREIGGVIEEITVEPVRPEED